MAAAAAANPFAGVPTFDFWLEDNDGEKMGEGFARVINDIQAAVASQSKSENGQVKAVTYPHPNWHYKVLLTPDSGFFAVRLWPPRNPRQQGNAEPVKFFFSFCNLYLLGFEHQNICHLFHDAKLGPGIDVETNPWLQRMRIKGAYRNDLHMQVNIAVQGLLQTYYTLLHIDENTPEDEIYKALYRIMVTVSEPLRFLEWLRELIFIFRLNKTDARVDVDGGRKFSVHFHNWKKRSRAVREGEAAFQGPKYGFDTYNALMSWSGVCLSKKI